MGSITSPLQLRLLRYMREKRLNQEKIAEAIGYSQQQISKFLNHSTGTLAFADRLGDYLTGQGY